jgi:hypothetical protein
LADGVAMSFTVLDLAKLSLAVYSHPPTAVDQWEPVRRFGSQEKHGFYAVLYRREQLHVLAYRGTDDWQVDLIDDATILLGWISSQMGRARNALQTSRERLRGVGEGKLCLTGHSLGGGLAALIAAQYDLPCVTFNAPGTKRSFKSHYIKNVTGAPYFAPMIKITTPHETNDGRILNIRARFDLVSVGTGPALGDTDSINVKCEGPTGQTVTSPAQAVGQSVKQMFLNPAARMIPTVMVASALGSYVLCQHQMSRMLREVEDFDKYKQDLGW